MKSFLKKYLYSSALDEDRRVPDVAWAQDLALIDRRLRTEKPGQGSAPPSLHELIMSEVRRCAKSATKPPTVREHASWWWLAPAAAAVLVLALFANVHPDRRPRLSSPAVLVQVEMASLPGKAVAPLADELEKLNQDLADTGKFLAASVPGGWSEALLE